MMWLNYGLCASEICGGSVKKILESGEYVNKDTGEVFVVDGKLVEIRDGDKIITKDQSDGYKENLNKRKIYNDVKDTFGEFLFIKIKDEITSLQNIDMPESYIPRVLFLSTFADENGLLRENGDPIKQKRLNELLDIGRTSFSRMINLLIKNNVLNKTDDGFFTFSKEYIVKGSIPKVNKQTYYVKMFINATRDLYNNLDMTKKSNYKAFVIGVHLLPFMHKNELILRYNNGIVITVRDVIEMLGLSAEKYYRQISYIKHLKLPNGESMIKILTDSLDKEDIMKAKLVINPKVFYYGSAENHMELYQDFFKLEDKW